MYSEVTGRLVPRRRSSPGKRGLRELVANLSVRRSQALTRYGGGKLTHFQEACRQLGIAHRRILFGHPQSIGRIERFHRTLREVQRPKVSPGYRGHQAHRQAKGRGEEILARREELFSCVNGNGRRPKVLAAV